jgi:NADH:ubiquinone oxidoreductase subunit F (NADH-binding)
VSAAESPTLSAAGGTAPSQGGALPRVLAGVHEGVLDLYKHLDVHGPLPAWHAGRTWRGKAGESPLIEETFRAGVLGRGGAAFPLARKLHAVARARGTAIVIANGTEGEPASQKDRTLLALTPHLVLDGTIAAAEAVGATEAIVAVCELAEDCVRSLELAIAERESAGKAPHEPSLSLATAPGHYVAGQETALVSYLDGGAALPTFTPPRPYERGVARRPTLVSNVETLAQLALVARHGASWYRALGTPASAGSALVTLSGPVASPGVYEIELGASLASLLNAAGGTTAAVRGVLVGGYAGSFVSGARLRDLALSDEHLAAHGARIGAGVVALLSEDACPVAETARLSRWMAGQSSRQCGPCEHGLDAIAEAVADIAHGQARESRLAQLSALVTRRGACGHPDGTAAAVLSAVAVFKDEFDAHARHGLCERCPTPPELPFPRQPVTTETARRRTAGA